jgi:hypothetical protein
MRLLDIHVLRTRLRRSGAASPAQTRLEELEAELVLLREENARLAAEQVCAGNPGRVVEQLRAVSAHVDAASSEADDAWEQMAEALVTRELVLSISIELERLGARLRQQLEARRTPEPLVVQLGAAHERSPGSRTTDHVRALPRAARPPLSSPATEGV